MNTFEDFSNFVGSLVGAVRGGCTTEVVNTRYKDMFQEDINYNGMGYSSLNSLLEACAKKGMITRTGNCWYPKKNKDNEALLKLVDETRPTVKNGNIKTSPRHLGDRGAGRLRGARSKNVPLQPIHERKESKRHVYGAAFNSPPTDGDQVASSSDGLESILISGGRSRELPPDINGAMAKLTCHLPSREVPPPPGYESLYSGRLPFGGFFRLPFGSSFSSSFDSSNVLTSSAVGECDPPAKNDIKTVASSGDTPSRQPTQQHCFGPTKKPQEKVIREEDLVDNANSSSPKLTDKETERLLLTANLTYRILKVNDERIGYQSLCKELGNWNITFNETLFCELIANYPNVFECEFTRKGHFVYLSEGAKPPTRFAVVPNSNLLQPIVTETMISDCKSASRILEEIHLDDLEVVPYRSGTYRFKIVFRRSSDHDRQLFSKLNTDIHEFYKNNWDASGLRTDQLSTGDHLVMLVRNKQVKRVRFEGINKDGSLKVFSLDDNSYEETSASNLNREFRKAFDSLRRSSLSGDAGNTRANIQIYCNPSATLFHVVQLRVNRRCLPDCFIKDHFIELINHNRVVYSEEENGQTENNENDSDAQMWHVGVFV
ncbi:unnamed protein product [Anisakis simplex]|uniref:Tudor domain-containing protein n=1 Tax=Anisakis simplex TaxID=6269 RepID=A0A0M3K6D0_ANISI|nr:unnamed protein product [Anisakis simplex]